jgi:hypothetical protein
VPVTFSVYEHYYISKQNCLPISSHLPVPGFLSDVYVELG